MTHESLHVTLGQVALVRAMIRKGHTAAMAAEALGAKVGTINNVLKGRRGVGVALGMRIEATYGVAMELFRMRAPEGTVLPALPRLRRAPMKEAA